MSPPKSILVATDFSQPSTAALNYAKMLAGALGASLHVLHVMEDPLLGIKWPDYECPIPVIRKQLEREAAEHLDELLTADERAKLKVSLTAEWGKPYAKVLSFAEEHNIDLIVMGTHGRGALEHALMGSVAERVVRHAVCPVLTIRDVKSA
jgi:nucleotide-binding universal stress UspA family protein